MFNCFAPSSIIGSSSAMLLSRLKRCTHARTYALTCQAALLQQSQEPPAQWNKSKQNAGASPVVSPAPRPCPHPECLKGLSLEQCS